MPSSGLFLKNVVLFQNFAFLYMLFPLPEIHLTLFPPSQIPFVFQDSSLGKLPRTSWIQLNVLSVLPPSLCLIPSEAQSYLVLGFIVSLPVFTTLILASHGLPQCLVYGKHSINIYWTSVYFGPGCNKHICNNEGVVSSVQGKVHCVWSHRMPVMGSDTSNPLILVWSVNVSKTWFPRLRTWAVLPTKTAMKGIKWGKHLK